MSKGTRSSARTLGSTVASVVFTAAVAAAALTAAPARADAPPVTTAKVGDMALIVDGGRLYVSKGKARAPLHYAQTGDATADHLEKVVVDTAGKKLSFDVVNGCGGAASLAFTFDALAARLVNVEGLTALRKKDYAAAATSFAQAVKLDPDFDLAAENLASALALGGKPDDAAAALAPWIAKDPTWVYARVAADPDLKSLRTHATITALRAKKKGSAKLAIDKIVGDVAYSAERGELAVVRVEAGWGACGWQSDLEIYDARTGAPKRALELVAWGDSDMDCAEDSSLQLDKARGGAVRARAAALQGALRDLGFSPAKVESGGEIDYDADHTVAKLHFKKAKLGVASSDDGNANVLRGNDVVAHGDILEKLHSGDLVSDAKAVVLWSGRAGHEGCEGTDPTRVTVIPLP